MMYEVTGGQESVRVEGDNWLMALGASMDFFGLDPSGLARLAIDMRPGGEVKVKDPITGQAFRLTPVEDRAPAAPVRLKLGAMKAALASLPESERASEEPSEEAATDGGAPPPFIMPSSIFAPPPELAPRPGDPEDIPTPTDEAPMPGVGAIAPTPPPIPPPTPPTPPTPPNVQTITPSLPPSLPSLAETGPITAEIALSDELVDLDDETNEVPGVVIDPRLVSGVTADLIREDTGRASHVKAPAEAEDDRPESLHEELFFQSMDITAAATVDAGCQAALKILRELIPSESGGVLYASINDTDLHFVTAYGPAARKIVGKSIPMDTGVAGFCHLRGLGMIINDAGHDERHDTSVDRATGYHTERLLSAGIRDHSGNSFGCIQLLNPPDDFRDWHLEAVQVIASELADFIALRQ